MTLVINWYSQYKIRYSIEPKNGIGYELSLFAKSIGKGLSSKYRQKILIVLKKSGATKVAIYAIKIASKAVIQKTEEATCHLIDNKITDKITNASMRSKKMTTKYFRDNWK